MANDPVYVKGPRGNLIQVLVKSAKTFEFLISDSYLSDAGHGIGQQLVWPHRFYCDGGGGESSLASNSKRSPSTSRPPVAKKPRNQHQLLPTESEGRRSSSEGTRAGGVSRFSEEKDEKEVLGRSEKGVTCLQLVGGCLVRHRGLRQILLAGELNSNHFGDWCDCLSSVTRCISDTLLGCT